MSGREPGYPGVWQSADHPFPVIGLILVAAKDLTACSHSQPGRALCNPVRPGRFSACTIGGRGRSLD